MSDPITGVAVLALVFGMPVLGVVVPRVINVIKTAELHPLPHPGGLSTAFGMTLLGLFEHRLTNLHPVARQLRLMVIEVGYMVSIALFVYIFFVTPPYPQPENFYLLADPAGFYAFVVFGISMFLVATGIPGSALAVTVLVLLSLTRTLDCYWPMLGVLLFGPMNLDYFRRSFRPKGTRGQHNSRKREWFRPQGRENPPTRR